MRKTIQVYLIASLATFSVHLSATGLPAEHEAARLMIAVEELVEQSKWTAASDYLSQLQTMDVELGEEYPYYQGQVKHALGELPDAIKYLERYVIAAGTKGRYYKPALVLITQIKNQLDQAQVAQQKDATSSLPDIQSHDDGYIKSLQALYLTKDPVSALVQQINSLLSSHAYTGSRLKRNENRAGLKYALSVSGNQLLIQERSYKHNQPFLQVEKLSVLGVDPYVEYGCSSSELLCYLYHPSKSNERWIVVDRDSLVVSELSQAFSKLIRLLQEGA